MVSLYSFTHIFAAKTTFAPHTRTYLLHGATKQLFDFCTKFGGTTMRRRCNKACWNDECGEVAACPSRCVKFACQPINAKCGRMLVPPLYLLQNFPDCFAFLSFVCFRQQYFAQAFYIPLRAACFVYMLNVCTHPHTYLHTCIWCIFWSVPNSQRPSGVSERAFYCLATRTWALLALLDRSQRILHANKMFSWVTIAVSSRYCR